MTRRIPLPALAFFARRSRSLSLSSLLLTALATVSAPASQAQTVNGPALAIDAAADRWPISPYIYGVNAFGQDPTFLAFMKELHLPVNRWGGDGTTRYNWQVDASNAGLDWYYMAGSGVANPVPGASTDGLITSNFMAGSQTILTIPIIDYINKVSQWDCSYPVSLFGPQQSVNPYVHPYVNGQQTDAGNGFRKSDGSQITLTPQEILRIHIPNTPAFQHTWLRHLLGKYGPASRGGVAFYQLDNEPSGWGNTHRDIHPDGTGYDELVGKSQAYAAMIKATDGGAAVLGPSDFGWPAYIGMGKPGDDANSHGIGFAEYYLQQMAAYNQKYHVRLLNYFDEHYYPTSDDGVGPLALSPAGDAKTQALRLRSTRSLWDPTYVENDWIGKYYGAISLLPRFHQWVNKDYPNTKIAITEYNFGGLEDINGALTQADVLGIFGRERLDLATIWGPPAPTQPGAFAFRIYRNYDGLGGQYGETWVRSTSGDQGKLALYSSVRAKDGALTVIVINKTATALTSVLTFAHFTPANVASVFRYSGANLNAIVHPVNQPIIRAGKYTLTATYPAYSITLFVVSRG